MFLKGGKTGDFLKDHPNVETLLTKLYNEEVKNTKIGKGNLERLYDQRDIKDFIESVNEGIKFYDTFKLIDTSQLGFKYEIELLGNNDSDYKLLRESLKKQV